MDKKSEEYLSQYKDKIQERGKVYFMLMSCR